MTDSERVIYTIPRRDGEEVRATLAPFRGRLYANVRLFVRGLDGAWRATKHGLTIAAEELDHLEAAVRALRSAVDDDTFTPRRESRESRYNDSRREAAGR